jgi:predicted PurR-regulated permease PerM
MPAVSFLESRTKLSHKASVNITYLLAILLFMAIPATVVPVLIGEFQNILLDLSDFPAQIQTWLAQPLDLTIWNYVFHINLYKMVPDITEALSALINFIPHNALRIIETTSRNITWGLVILVVAYYLLLDWDEILHWVYERLPESFQPDARRLYDHVSEIWSSYLRGQWLVILILAVAYTIGWAAIGLPGAFLLGILAGVLNIIPELGPLIAVVLAIIVALIEGSYYFEMSNFWFAVLVVGVYGVLNYAKNIWIVPRVVGRSVKLHEGVIFVAIIAALFTQGVLGVLIVVPTLASLLALGEYTRRRILGLPPFPIEEESAENLPPSETETTA